MLRLLEQVNVWRLDGETAGTEPVPPPPAATGGKAIEATSGLALSA
jgi:hypothetical protein